MDNVEKSVKKQKFKAFNPQAILNALSPDFFNEGKCREVILKILHPDGACCPECGATFESEAMIKNFWELRRCHCDACNKWFTAATGTILHGSQMSMRQVFILAILLSLGVKDEIIARACGISSGTVRLWRLKFSIFEKGRGF